jgi:hypothetical protein
MRIILVQEATMKPINNTYSKIISKSHHISKATFHTSPFFLKNTQFDISDKVRDNCLYMFYSLKKKFEDYGIDLSTQDINPPSISEFVIYNEMPQVKDIILCQNNYLLILESEIIRPDNWNTENHKYFKKVFTWNDKLVDNKKYFKINYAQKIPDQLDFESKKKEKLCTLIAGNKKISDKRELYSERVKAIRWFEENHPEDFDLYGMGWDRYYFSGVLYFLNRFDFLTKLLKAKYPSYKGVVKSKNEIFEKYKFAICYENARAITGYITEKIFDCFFAGCVPVYWGAPNVTDFIPADTFIDKREFKTYGELYSYLKNMSDSEYKRYLESIKHFVKSNKISPFSAEFFAEKITNEIMEINDVVK